MKNLDFNCVSFSINTGKHFLSFFLSFSLRHPNQNSSMASLLGCDPSAEKHFNCIFNSSPPTAVKLIKVTHKSRFNF